LLSVLTIVLGFAFVHAAEMMLHLVVDVWGESAFVDRSLHETGMHDEVTHPANRFEPD